jgi:hypothetical protein
MKKSILLKILLLVLVTSVVKAQDVGDTTQSTIAKVYQDIEIFKRIKVSGYIQAQWQLADSAGQKSFAGGDFKSGVDNRFALRRGRVKFQYDAPFNEKGFSTSQYVLQFDVTEKGMTIKDAYAKITDPWTGWFSLTAGVQNRPFGYEVSYSSSLRESPERGRMSQIIFPNERDLGAMLTIQGPKSSNWNWLKLDAGFFNGTGAPSAGVDASDFDKFKDFIGHASLNKASFDEKMKFGFGVSYYNGGYRIDSVNVYKAGTDSLGTKGFTYDSKNTENGGLLADRKKTNREYIGVDAQFSIAWAAGLTTLRAEYIQGNQPGTSGSTTSPAALPTSSILDTLKWSVNPIATPSDIYNRKFNGAYFYFLHNILQTPLQVIVKYDWYDPNTDVAGDDLGKAVKQTGFKSTNSSDVKFTTLGFGLAYRWDANVKITAYYDNVKNETSTNLSGFTKDIKDNLFTLRLQVKF